jgi:hypothetical protein
MDHVPDPAALAQRFRPVYRLHSEEMWYPCHPEDQLRCADLVSTADGSIVIPALGADEGSPADQLLCTPLGLDQLAARGVTLPRSTVTALQPAATSSRHYNALVPTSAFVLRRADDTRFLPPYGWIASENFEPPLATWFHRGAPNNPFTWLGGDPAGYAAAVLHPPPGTSRGAWREPTTAAWVQHHTVAGVTYVDVIYTAMLGWNGSISFLAGQGEHPNDVETTVVRFAATDLDHPVRYMFQQHGGLAWYEPDAVEADGDRVVVYLARQSHECYPHAGRSVRLYGFADDLCDARGVTWDAPVQYTHRPQGVDRYGEDTDALRCSIRPGDPSRVVLVPVDDPGPLWQYVRFRFLGRRPATVPIGDEDFLFQPFPLHTTKFWPDEGPAAAEGPLSTLAAEPSGPGVPASFFADVAPYLGPDPLPACPGIVASPRTARRPPALPGPPPYQPTTQETVLGRDIGGGTGRLAAEATFVDWRGGIGAYLTSSIDAHIPGWIALLPEPLTTTDIVGGGGLTIETLSVRGLTRFAMAPVTAVSATDLHVRGSSPDIDCAATISFAGVQNVSMSVTISALAVDATARMITPVVIPSDDPAQWYVPYVGPLPYSYATVPFATSSLINNGSVTAVRVRVEAVTASVGVEWEDAVIDWLLVLFKQTIEDCLADALKGQVNALLADVYSGVRRIG